ncbi:hypothetical protein JCM3766R1_006307 [Sporobolomyces carnicolor]
MRSIALVSIVSSLALFASANPEPCSDHPGVIHPPGTFAPAKIGTAAKLSLPHPHKSASSPQRATEKKKNKKKVVQHAPAKKETTKSSHAWTPPNRSTEHKKKKAVPKIAHSSTKTVIDGANKAVDQFKNATLIPSPLASALASAVNEQLKPTNVVTITKTAAHVSTATSTVTRTDTVINANSTTETKTVIKLEPTTIVRTVTDNVTELHTSTLVTSQESIEAALDIKKAIEQALAAANLTQSALSQSTYASLEACLSTVLTSGGLPDGYSCLTESGKDGSELESTLNTILEQFVGILPNTILSAIFDSVTPLLTTLLPQSEQVLVNQIKDSIQSVIASATGGSVTALEQVSSCYSDAVKKSGNASTLACFTKPGGAQSTLETASKSILEQFVGVLPASLTTAVENILTYNLANSSSSSSADAKLAGQVSAQISNAITSVSSALSGNTVTLAETLQACASELVATGNATRAEECIKSSRAPEMSQTTMLSIAQQFEGYLPSSFFSDLVEYSTPFIENYTANAHGLTQGQLNAELEKFFNNQTEYGAKYVTCLSQVQQCVTNAIVKTGSIEAVCPGPVKGCQLSKSSSSRFAKRSYKVHHHHHEPRRFGFGGSIRSLELY